MDNPIAANALGVIGALCWSTQLLPQIILNARRRNTTGLQPSMMLLWAWAGVPLGVYNIVSGANLALQIQAQILAVLSLVTWMQCYHYERAWSARRALAVAAPLAALMAGVELGLVYAVRLGRRRGLSWPETLMAALATTFLALGVLRHYVDIWRHRTVRGISFLFVGIDALGDLTSLLSLLFQSQRNILGLAVYGVELALWMGVFACGGYYNLLPWIKLKLRAGTAHDSPAARSGEGGVAIHDLPSSTSVFRTPSSDIVLRTRATAPALEADDPA